MSKSEEFRLKVQRRREGAHDMRKRLAEEVTQVDKQELKDELRSLGRGDNNPEQGPPVLSRKLALRRGLKG